MFALFGKQKDRWNRRTQWTPLLHNQRGFQRVLAKERSRVERSGNSFGFIILRLEDLTNARKQTVQLAKILHKRLRDTDEKGHLGIGRIGVLLPETAMDDTELVLNQILKLAGDANLKIDAEAFCYPDRPDHSDPENGSDGSEKLQPAGTESATNPLASMVPGYPLWKRAMDVSFSILGFVFLSPVFLVVGCLVKLTSTGPIVFAQKRTGQFGNEFTIFKFRTMVVNAEELRQELEPSNERDGPAFKIKKDPRITPVGSFLRSTGLDELPQLWNVLVGDMALVGPRPLPVDEAEQCQSWQHRRLEVKPGLTCFWQISKSRVESFSEWMRLDLKYVRTANPLVDVMLILKTFVSVFLGRVGH